MFQVKPIGYFHTSVTEKYGVPRQPTSEAPNIGYIQLESKAGFEQALEGLEGFDRIWVVFLFHKNHQWKPKVMPPRGSKKRGVFATRAPHRPNFIGMSCVELTKIDGLKLYIENHDLIDGTPILDIKPYLNYIDSIPAKRQGWLEEIEEVPVYTIQCTKKAQNQFEYLEQLFQLDLLTPISMRLKINPFPRSNNRIKKQGETYELAYKTWKCSYCIRDKIINILEIRTGYDRETLKGEKASRWDDVSIHQAFVEQNFNEGESPE